MGSDMISNVVFILIAVYCIVRGVMTLMTGKLSQAEEARVRDFSANGLRRYKLLSAFSNIVAGAALIVMFVLRMLAVISPGPYRIIVIVFLVVYLIVFLTVRNSCKKI